MRPATSFAPSELFNCCTDYAEPNWRMFNALEVNGSVAVAEEGTNETSIVDGMSRDEAEFFTVYGHLIAGGCEAITDCETLDLAQSIGAHLSQLSGLTAETYC